jgi:uncharacterized Ntn-hydrolase superfamily protein
MRNRNVDASLYTRQVTTRVSAPTPDPCKDSCQDPCPALFSSPQQVTVATFSIAAVDRTTGELGAAVASRYIAVGSLVPHVAVNAGVILTQSVAQPLFGDQGLALLATGMAPDAVLNALLAPDADRNIRQLGILSADGRSAAFSGPDCVAAVGESSADGVICLGNTLAGPEVTDAMLKRFLTASGTLAERMVAALQAGEAAGGDKRGKQAAAVRSHRSGGGYRGNGEILVDLRVDDHPDPVTELKRILSVYMNDYRPDYGS